MRRNPIVMEEYLRSERFDINPNLPTARKE